MKKKGNKKVNLKKNGVVVESPAIFGDFGQDDAFATESHPEGLRYAEAPHAPGSLPHPKGKTEETPPHGDISIG